MRTVHRWHLSLSLLLLLALMSGMAQASVSGVSASSSNTRVALGRAATVSVDWRVTTVVGFNNNPPPTNVISSTQGQFWIPNTMLGTVNRTVSKNTGYVSGTFSIRETLVIPARVIYQAHKLGAATFDYRRSFSDLDAPLNQVMGQVTFTITSQGSAGLVITRQALYFDDGSVLKRVEQDEPLHALTMLNYGGSGLIKGIWEVATPASTAGEPLFMPLKPVRQFLGAGGEAVLRSPPLDTAEPGIYLVRFRMEEPLFSDEDFHIRYFVGLAEQGPPITLRLNTPADGSQLHSETRFSWGAVNGAVAYQLELYERPRSLDFDVEPGTASRDAAKNPNTLTGAPASGALIPAQENGVTLSGMSRQHLEHGRAYWWRVLAIGDGGKVISQSALREISYP